MVIISVFSTTRSLTLFSLHPICMTLGAVLCIPQGIVVYRNDSLLETLSPIMQHNKRTKVTNNFIEKRVFETQISIINCAGSNNSSNPAINGYSIPIARWTADISAQNRIERIHFAYFVSFNIGIVVAVAALNPSSCGNASFSEISMSYTVCYSIG